MDKMHGQFESLRHVVQVDRIFASKVRVDMKQHPTPNCGLYRDSLMICLKLLRYRYC